MTYVGHTGEVRFDIGSGPGGVVQMNYVDLESHIDDAVSCLERLKKTVSKNEKISLLQDIVHNLHYSQKEVSFLLNKLHQGSVS